MKEDSFEMAEIEQLTEVGCSYVPVAMQPVERDYRNPLFVERCRPGNFREFRGQEFRGQAPMALAVSCGKLADLRS